MKDPMNEASIEVRLVPDRDSENQETPYFYCVLAGGKDLTIEEIINYTPPSYDTRICGWAATPEAAFAEGLARYRARKAEQDTLLLRFPPTRK